ncbi:hypothetical protein [Paraburkholderia adhaesiva]|uniref:hypothetical protein n=1 Tax=Paraburkholderia adhaesiva TaxID=2883244 RepID=UPI001F15B17D|nr:hypothetical protein [Paraburkholderia adhaesiva]
MSAHRCCLRGNLLLKEHITHEAIAHAVAPLLEANGFEFTRELAHSAIEIQEDPPRLNLSIEFWGKAWYVDTELVHTAERLNQLVADHGCLELVDHDTADTESMIVPRFLGTTLLARNRARVQYAIDQASPWLEGALDAKALHSIRDYIASLEPLAEPLSRKSGVHDDAG